MTTSGPIPRNVSDFNPVSTKAESVKNEKNSSKQTSGELDLLRLHTIDEADFGIGDDFRTHSTQCLRFQSGQYQSKKCVKRLKTPRNPPPKRDKLKKKLSLLEIVKIVDFGLFWTPFCAGFRAFRFGTGRSKLCDMRSKLCDTGARNREVGAPSFAAAR